MTTDPRPWLDPEYVVTVPAPNIGTNVAIMLGVATANLCRRETLPSGAVVYRVESTGPIKALCGQADRLNRAAHDALPPLDHPPAEPIPLDDLEADLPTADDPAPCGSPACGCTEQDDPPGELLDRDIRAAEFIPDPTAGDKSAPREQA